jgi:hypothetical protein
MKFVIAVAVSAIALTIASSASASTASQREYKRGYADCAAGRWDDNQHGESYKKGCRAAEDKRDGAAGAAAGAAGTPAISSEPGPTAPTDPVVSAMTEACAKRAAKSYKTDIMNISTKYREVRLDGTHSVDGTFTNGDVVTTFQCVFDKKAKKITKFKKQ